jgi:hypothetical protein
LHPKGKVTSVTLRKSSVILWILFGTQNFSFETPDGYYARCEALTTSFIYKCMDNWPHPDGRGLSDFVLDLMHKDFLDTKNYRRYKRLMQTI